MTAREVAKAVGCCERTVRNARNGARLVGDNMLWRIAKVEGRDPVDYIINGRKRRTKAECPGAT